MRRRSCTAGGRDLPHPGRRGLRARQPTRSPRRRSSRAGSSGSRGGAVRAIPAQARVRPAQRQVSWRRPRLDDDVRVVEGGAGQAAQARRGVIASVGPRPGPRAGNGAFPAAIGQTSAVFRTRTRISPPATTRWRSPQPLAAAGEAPACRWWWPRRSPGAPTAAVSANSASRRQAPRPRPVADDLPRRCRSRRPAPNAPGSWSRQSSAAPDAIRPRRRSEVPKFEPRSPRPAAEQQRRRRRGRRRRRQVAPRGLGLRQTGAVPRGASRLRRRAGARRCRYRSGGRSWGRGCHGMIMPERAGPVAERPQSPDEHPRGTSRGAWPVAGVVAGYASLATSYLRRQPATAHGSPVVAVARTW